MVTKGVTKRASRNWPTLHTCTVEAAAGGGTRAFLATLQKLTFVRFKNYSFTTCSSVHAFGAFAQTSGALMQPLSVRLLGPTAAVQTVCRDAAERSTSFASRSPACIHDVRHGSMSHQAVIAAPHTFMQHVLLRCRWSRLVTATASSTGFDDFELDDAYYRGLGIDDDELEAQTTFAADDIGEAAANLSARGSSSAMVLHLWTGMSFIMNCHDFTIRHVQTPTHTFSTAVSAQLCPQRVFMAPRCTACETCRRLWLLLVAIRVPVTMTTVGLRQPYPTLPMRYPSQAIVFAGLGTEEVAATRALLDTAGLAPVKVLPCDRWPLPIHLGAVHAVACTAACFSVVVMPASTRAVCLPGARSHGQVLLPYHSRITSALFSSRRR